MAPTSIIKPLTVMRLSHYFKLVLVALTIPLSSCVSIKPYTDTGSTKTEHVLEQSPQIGEEVTVTVGSTVVRVKDYYVSTTTTNMLEVVSLPEGDSFWAGVAIGQKYPIVGTVVRGDVEYILAVCSSMPGALTCVHIDPVSLISVGFGNELVFGKKGAGAKFKYETVEEVSATGGFTNFELVYSGVSNNVLRLKYREYSPEDLARPAFFQDLTYSMDEDRIFFKEIEIEVLEANNRGIRYRLHGL